MEKKTKKKIKWVKKRHGFVRKLVAFFIQPYSRIKYGLRVEKLREGRDRQYLVLYNHQTAFDQFFVGIPFKKVLYYVASEDLFSNGFVSKLIKFLVNPIPIKKQSTDVRAVMTCIKVASEGGSIAIAPEGNRTYSGRTGYMNPAIAPLARKLGLPIAFVKIEGGYGTHPRWSDVVRKGRTVCRVSRIMEPTEYKDITDEELNEVINKELYVNEANSEGIFRHKKRAEYLERAVYVCPKCALSKFESEGDTVRCTKCGLTVKYGENKELQCDDESFGFRYFADWYEYQQKTVLSLDLSVYFDKPVYTDSASLREVIPYTKKLSVYSQAEILLYSNRIVAKEGDSVREYHFDDISSLAILGKNKLNVYVGKQIFQLKGNKRFNALKYLHILHWYQKTKGENYGKRTLAI